MITSQFGCRGFENAVNEGFIIPCESKIDYLNGINSIFNNSIQIIELQNKIYNWSNKEYNINEWRVNLLNSVKVIHE